MASTFNALLGAVVAAAFWTCLGLALARRVVPAPLAWPLAPTLGWAVYSAAMLPVFMGIGFTTATVLVTAVLILAVSVASLYWASPREDGPGASPPVWAWIGAVLLAIAPALAVLPKISGDSVALAPAIFDHSKIAIIDEMARLGVPPGNPFFGETGGPVRLAYYYLFHFSAAGLVLVTGISGWEADAAMTWFAGFSSLALMMGFAAWFVGRTSAALWVLPFAAAASLRTVLDLMFRPEQVSAILRWATGLGAWLVQASWAPQHLISASCVVLAVFLLSRLTRQRSALLIAALVLVVAAAFESSAWVGGVTFVVAALLATLVLLARLDAPVRLPFIAGLSIAALLVICLVAPFLYDQGTVVAARGGGMPVALQPYHVLGNFFPEGLRRLLDLPAYWLVFLPLEFPAIYPIGLAALASILVLGKLEPDRAFTAAAFAALAGASLAVSWLFISTVGYNDLGWRAVVPAMMVLTIFSGAGLSHWIAARAAIPIAATAALLALGLVECVSIIRENAIGKPSEQGRVFARTPAMWAAVRRHAGPDDRISNNPLFLDKMTPWPGNISWALMANRRSCFAGDQLVLALSSLPSARRKEIDVLFIQVFAGDGSADDIRELATRYDCKLIVLTPEDGAWMRDPFAASGLYDMIETEPAQWRIYRLRTSGERTASR